MAGDGIAAEREGESSISEVREVLWHEINRNLGGDRGRIVGEHEALQRFVSLFVGGGDLQGKACKLGGVVCLAGDVGLEDHWILGGARGLLAGEEAMGKLAAGHLG